MGNTASQHNPSSTDNLTALSNSEKDISRTPNTELSPFASNNSDTSTSAAVNTKIHPLLHSSDINRPKTSSPTTAMVQDHSSEPEQSNLTKSKTNPSLPDVTMSGTGTSHVNLVSQPSSMNIDNEPLISEHLEGEQSPPPRRRSTIILTDDPEFEKLKLTKVDGSDNNDTSEESTQATGRPEEESHPEHKTTVPVEIQWLQGGESVFITGSFTGWRKMIKLVKESDGKFSLKLRLPYGTHRFRFIVDNELRFSDYLPTATDQMGNFINYIEIQTPEASLIQQDHPEQSDQHVQPTQKDSNLGLTNDDDDMGNGYTRFHEEKPNAPTLDYVRDIPAIFTDPSVMEQYYLTLDNNQSQNQSWLTPPQLPPHLESVILNNYSATDKSNSSGALPIPNHVVLNHLATTSIKHNTLAVASVVRYKRKYVTQVLYAPLQ